MKWILLFLLMECMSCAFLQNNSFMYSAAILNGTDTAVYSLPYEKGNSYVVVQGYQSVFSHAGNYAIDFKMRQGTKVLAARDGIVIYIRDTMKRGGVGKRYVNKANRITIKHSDGTYSHYLHLQYKGALVSVGDSVHMAQPIGLSGSTGFSAFPHLHFEVTCPQRGEELPVMFKTKNGTQFLQPLRCYKAL